MEYKQVKFKNNQFPNTFFDILKLQNLFEREDLNHSIEDFHRIDFYALLLIEEGAGYHSIDFVDYQCSLGTILTIRKNQIHKFFRSNSIRGSLFLFTDDFLIRFLEKSENLKIIQLFNDLLTSPKTQLSTKEFLEIQQIKQRIEQEFFHIRDEASITIIRSELHILMTKLFRIKSRSQNFNIDKKYVKEFIEFQNLVENNVFVSTKVKYYANLLGMSTKKLNTTTQKMVNKSAKEFIDDVSIRQIKRLLINTSFSIKEIAYKSGFEETTNFYKYFKRHTQTTPEQFRSAY